MGFVTSNELCVIDEIKPVGDDENDSHDWMPPLIMPHKQADDCKEEEADCHAEEEAPADSEVSLGCASVNRQSDRHSQSQTTSH